MWTVPVGRVCHVYQRSRAVPQQRQVARGRDARGRPGRRSAATVVVGLLRRARADQAVDEARARLDRRGGADAEEAVAVLDEALQRGLTGGVEHVAADVEEDERLVAVELGRVDVGDAGGLVDGEVVRVAERLDGGDAARCRWRWSRP